MIDRYLLMKPSIRGIFEWGVFILGGYLADFYFHILFLPFKIFFTVFGITLFICGMLIHWLSHKEHKQAHMKVEHIEKIVTGGIYSKIRHPGYLGLILAYFGLSFLFINMIPVVIAIVLSTLYIVTALKEEEYLINKFGKDYEEYMRRVRWRFIPKIF
ncbi:ERG4/ERG24 ergosterol biosynthesis protein [Thermodesulfobium narugense DSM 14796]|uniref:ERG4/ERG24 ergosterol biosynthesis protein n=1 Tax=Thermodesulfobium narugense DSM 14796 TaxID=747365 RepID=M1E715_9BACT|nr:isoprenylcysteine carboxylmethyltransferase family protein [Thermodesulfobium narugense]AEE14428.1 ERG4/ERG24 ergosterol biosynthesis protein [Thermodesulfobium narugense DSM 14796]